MLEPVHINDGDFVVHAFRAEDIKKEKLLSRDIYEVLSDESTTRFVPGKKLSSLKEAQLYFRGNLLSYHAGKNFLHFITDKQSQKIVGMIDLISPQLAQEHYRLGHYPYFVEFYLKREYQGRGIMAKLLPDFVKQLREKNIKEIGAVVNRGNVAAKRTLINAGFNFNAEFDFLQDFYISTLN